MQDKPVLQQRLSRDLASLVTTLQHPVVLPFLSAFWVTISREWGSIEALRMDKYLFLIRQYVNASFRYLSQNEWADEKGREEYMEILSTTPLSPEDVKVPNGLRYHVLDVYVDELEKVGDAEWDVEVLESLLKPVRRLQTGGRDRAVREAAREMLEDERLSDWGCGDKKADRLEEDRGEWGGIEG